MPLMMFEFLIVKSVEDEAGPVLCLPALALFLWLTFFYMTCSINLRTAKYPTDRFLANDRDTSELDI